MCRRYWTSLWSSFLVAQLTFVGAICAQTETADEKTDTAANAEQAPAIDPTGIWKWQYDLNDNTAEFMLKLDWDGKNLSGKYTAFDRTSDIEKATLDNDHLSFVVKREFNNDQFEVHFDGKAEPDEINGTAKLNLRGEPREFEWHAKRAVEIDDVVGVWDLKVQTPNGLVEPRLTITKQGDKLNGKSWSRVFGEREAKNLQLKENELSWEVSGESNGLQFKIVYSGRPRGNKIEGANKFDFGGNTGTMEFTGKRTPPEDKNGEAPVDESESAVEAAPATSPIEAKPADAAETQTEGG